MIAIIDYDAGNIKSVEKALISLGQEVCVTRDADEILQADKVILPGVGAFRGCHGETSPVRTGGGDPEGGGRRGHLFWGSAWGCSFCFERSDEASGSGGHWDF